jgi:hypothetical protein
MLWQLDIVFSSGYSCRRRAKDLGQVGAVIPMLEALAVEHQRRVV